MMTVDRHKYSRFLEKVAEDLDIPPGKYQDAVDRYQSVGRWLEEGEYPDCSTEPDIYPQGSFRLGTVVRPIRGGVEASYDIDLVCELSIEKQRTDPCSVKTMVGDRLRDHGTYRKLLDEEGKRCWTLEYAEDDRVGFHLDVLPSVPDSRGLLDASIAITNKQGTVYDWSASNPGGYGLWFDSKNQTAFALARFEQKRSIQARAPDIYARVDDVPDQLIRTPLQRSVQLMKRHRDVKFDDVRYNGYAPISIIITTLAAQFYQNEPDIYSALTGIVSKLNAHAVLVDNRTVDRSLAPFSPITRTPDGKWYLGNPVNPDENFADRWHEDNHARARAFFSWVTALQEDLLNVLAETRPDTLRKRQTQALGASVVSGHLDLVAPAEAAVVSPPRIHISGAAKPWRA
jgi:hypothetical protein